MSTPTPFAAKVKRRLTRPILKFVEDKPRYIKVQDKMYVGKEMKQKPGDDKKKEPATLINCVNLEDGIECQIIVNAVVKSVLTEEYPNDTYVGKCFSITKQARQPGKAYNPFDIVEIEDPAPPAAGTTKK